MTRTPSRVRRPQVSSTGGGSLLDLLDHMLNQGVVLGGELVIGLANVDFVYARLWVLLCAADRVLPSAASTPRRGRASP
jgi:hypothetical protein